MSSKRVKYRVSVPQECQAECPTRVSSKSVRERVRCLFGFFLPRSVNTPVIATKLTHNRDTHIIAHKCIRIYRDPKIMAHKRALSPFQAFETLSVISADDGKRFKRLDVSREVIRGVRGRGGRHGFAGFWVPRWVLRSCNQDPHNDSGPTNHGSQTQKDPKKQSEPTKP